MRTVLAQVSQGESLPGNHHFYISFSTTLPGVGISKRLKDQYPDEMTIVLQHRYWDLQVHDDRFEVSLTFNSIPERLIVPFVALKVFFDPSVPYGLQFDNAGAGPPALLPDRPGESVDLPQRRAGPKRAKPVAVPRDGVVSVPRHTGASIEPIKPKQAPERAAAAPAPVGLPKPKPAASTPVAASRAEPPPALPSAAEPAARVVQLDTFRKK